MGFDVNFSHLQFLPAGVRKAIFGDRSTPEGTDGKIWASRDGSLVNLPWKQALVAEGRVFNMTIGALSTGLVGGGAGTVPELAEPEFIISVPSGACILPFRVDIQGTAADAVADHSTLEIILAVDTAKAWDGTGTATAETPVNMRTGYSRPSLCTCRSAFTADSTAPTETMDLAREEVKIDLPANGETPIIVHLLYEPDVSPLIVGPAQLWGMWGGTSALTGYAQIVWAEFMLAEAT